MKHRRIHAYRLVSAQRSVTAVTKMRKTRASYSLATFTGDVQRVLLRKLL